MAFRQSSSDRRRRVLRDETGISAPADVIAANESAGATAEPKQSYSADAHPERQTRITDLIPISLWSIAGLILLAGASIAGIEAAYAYLPRLEGYASAQDLTALDLNSPANLSRWFSSLLLLLAAGASYLIYRIRKHRNDDYRGFYRVWTPMGMMFILASIDAVAPISRAAAGILANTTGYQPPVEWTVAIVALPVVWFTIRGLLEVYRSRAATMSLLLMIVAYATVAAVDFPLVTRSVGLVGEPITTIVATTALMLGHLFALGSVVMFGRYVRLDALGKIQRRVPKPKAASTAKKSKSKRTSSSSKSTKSPASGDPSDEPDTISISGKTASDKTDADASGNPVNDAPDENPDPPMSKSQKRKLRKQKKSRAA